MQPASQQILYTIENIRVLYKKVATYRLANVHAFTSQRQMKYKVDSERLIYINAKKPIYT